MKKIDDIAKIKQSFEAQNFSAPTDLWKSVEEGLDSNAFNAKIKSSFEGSTLVAPAFDFSALSTITDRLDNLVGDSFEQTSVAAPSTSWEKIQNGLDTNEVWEKVVDEIKVGSNKWTSVLVAASIAVLFTLIPSVLSDQELETVEYGAGSILTVAAPVEAAKTILLADNDELTHDNTDQPIVHPTDNVVENVISNPIGLGNPSIVVTPIQPVVEEPVSLNENSSIDLLAVSNIAAIKTGTFHPDLEINPLQHTVKPSLSVGIIGGANSTWILDNETRASFERETLSDSKIAVGEMYGFTADLWMNEKNGFSTNVLVNSVSRNRLGYYDNGVYRIKKSQINFFKISALYARKFRVFGKEKDLSFVLKAGPYLGINRRSYIKEGETLTSFNSAYKKVNYGLNVQIGQEFEWSNFVLGYGLNSEVGLRNMFKGNGTLPSDLNYTSNIDAGVYVSLKYKLN